MTSLATGYLRGLFTELFMRVRAGDAPSTDSAKDLAESVCSPELESLLEEYAQFYLSNFGPGSAVELQPAWQQLNIGILRSLSDVFGEASNNGKVRDQELAALVWKAVFSLEGGRRIWTSNVSGQQLHGREVGGPSLELQRSALERGYSITRVFVYDPENLAELKELERTIRPQLAAEITVRRITLQQYALAAGTTFIERFSTDDVMLIDDAFAVTTARDQQGRKAASLIRIDDKNLLDRLVAVRREVDRRSKLVTPDNILVWDASPRS